MKIAGEFTTQIACKHEKYAVRIRTVLDYYCQHVQPNSASVIFQIGEFEDVKAPDLVRNYCWFLSEIGLARQALRFEGADGTKRKFPRVDWYSQWGAPIAW